MKPHIRKTRGVWICDLWQKCSIGKGRYVILPYHLPQPMGHGYTPAQAYADWQEQTRAVDGAVKNLAQQIEDDVFAAVLRRK